MEETKGNPQIESHMHGDRVKEMGKNRKALSERRVLKLKKHLEYVKFVEPIQE